MAMPANQPPQGDAITRRYDMIRNQAKSNAGQQQQQVDDALKRRAAATGNLNSGSYAKQVMVAGDMGARRQDEALGQVNAQELAERSQLEEAERGRQFQSGEAQTQRGFLSEENALQRRFQDEQARAGERFQRGETIDAFERQKPYLDADQAIRYQTANLAERQFKNDETAQLFNMGISAMQTASPEFWPQWLALVESKFPELARNVRSPGTSPGPYSMSSSNPIRTAQAGGR